MSPDFRDDLAALIPRLRRFAHALTGSREEGDEIVQTACVKALDRAEQFMPGTRLDSWMFRIIKTTFLDDRRRVARRGISVDPEEAGLSDGGGTSALAEAQLTLARVRAAMASLPAEQRAVLALVTLEDYSYQEAADALGTPVGTVMSRLARARTRLARLVEGEA